MSAEVMDDAKRFDCTNGKAQCCYGCYEMTETVDGDYVQSKDFDTALAREAELQQRLTIAERRNVELAELIKEALYAFNYDPEGRCYSPGLSFVKPWSIRAAELVKPTESGASE